MASAPVRASVMNDAAVGGEGCTASMRGCRRKSDICRAGKPGDKDENAIVHR